MTIKYHIVNVGHNYHYYKLRNLILVYQSGSLFLSNSLYQLHHPIRQGLALHLHHEGHLGIALREHDQES